ncbi:MULTISPECIES: Flp family type IVb pilin [Rhizobium]|uniref:Flp family type IVb pilin n=1 Tax=Rhizobium rhododendri TaxID=2506430 RepID=A0ABY8IF23_9HYPH|nr:MULTISPECIES: Flp family type IVb pilin [Rhizobium]MBO9099948.1 Flp family type IVb pilin [Rhizobium sp. L58/93]MBO9135840.1 Flp family type IVb pilin [Rhizobium sp. B209b/85]MBO9169937.1 Flp family type IVb pilin [Rhizobium sp. L245/93]MBO9185895.1 Flp family type IVb pilin [Rhizobium sp. E27B/91]MBZ5760967.1 Flp family type IVb pilin [Rhizobium sp. VS19-DR96]
MHVVRKLIDDKIGATAIEYGLIAGLIAVALIVSLGLLGSNLSNMFNFFANKVSTP